MTYRELATARSSVTQPGSTNAPASTGRLRASGMSARASGQHHRGVDQAADQLAVAGLRVERAERRAEVLPPNQRSGASALR